MAVFRLTRALAFALAAVVAAVLPSVGQASIVFGSNLITNPGSELGASLGGGSTALTGWTVLSGPANANGFTGFSWTFGAGYPVYGDPGPMPAATRGSNFFYGGLNSTSSSGGQTITGSTAQVQAAIDAGLVTYDLNGWLGGFASQNDNARLTLDFLSATNALLGSVQLGPVSNADRNNLTALLFRQGLGTVPVGTRSLQLTLLMTRTEGTSNDGYADNLSLILNGPDATPVPEPATLVTLAVFGLGVMCWRRAAGRACAGGRSAA